jgi:hypothetical protein
MASNAMAATAATSATTSSSEPPHAHAVTPAGAPIELIDGVLIHKDRSASGEDPMSIGKEHSLVVIYEQPSPDDSYQRIAVRRAGETVALCMADGEHLEILADRILP